jgi:hypothetical protein
LDNETKKHTLKEIRQKAANNKKIWIKFVETKIMQDQVIRNYEKTWEKTLPVIGYIA